MNILNRFGSNTIGILLVLALLGGIIYVIYNHKKDVEKCSKLDDNVFTAPNGSCYSCPENYTVMTKTSNQTKKTDSSIDPYDSWNDDYEYSFKFIQNKESRNLLKTNDLGIPICNQVKKSQMDNLGKTSSPAIESASGFRAAEDLGSIYAKANILDSSKAPVIQDGKEFSKSNVCADAYQNKGSWVAHDPMTNTCKVCPPGFTKNSAINDYNNDKVCVSNGILRTTYSGIQTHPFNFNQNMTAMISEPDNGIPALYMKYMCPPGYERDPNTSLTGPNACYKVCPVGTVTDGASGNCITCPKGYSRTTAQITSEKSCKRDCSNGVEANGKCFKCPEGYIKNPGQPLSTGEACVIKCPKGSFRIGGKCYQCPTGYQRNKAAIKSTEVCYKPCQEGTYEDKSLQSCFKCPDGYTMASGRSPTNPDACIREINRPANLVALQSKNGEMKSPEETRKMVQEVQRGIAE